MNQDIKIPNRLFRYNIFDNQKFIVKNKDEVRAQEKWKFTVFDGLLFPSSPFYFNDPYDCGLCIEPSFLYDDATRKMLLDILKKYFIPKPSEIKKILESENLIEDCRIVISQHGIKIDEEFDKTIFETIRNLENIAKSRFSIVCFSDKNDSILMWSHYAHYHTGFCIEYDLTEKKVFNDNIRPVNYIKSRVIIDKSVQYNQDRLMEAVLTKSDEWSYENEWRLIISNISGLYANVKNNIQSIYLGAKVPENKKNEIMDYFKNSNVTIFQMELDRYNYKLIPKKILHK